ncbi:MAG: L,D-transpeptidase family protein [Hyphomicrobiales bacterium]|nr:L,D-transpeptidase family protein [Hyphomicrobiales bacterium]
MLLNLHKIVKTYRVSLGGNPLGTKTREGDSRTPEETYRINWRNAKSAYHLSLHLSYSNSQDRSQALVQGVSPGGNIMIHGIKNGLGWFGIVHHLWDWTDGCIAVTNRQIREIWHAVPNGTIVDLRT